MFPFPKKLSEVWSDNPFWGHNFIRKCERKVFLTLEFGVKSVYAWLIKMGTHSVYGIAETEVYASLLCPPDSFFADPRVRRILAVNDSIAIVTLPHYQGFTDAVPSLAATLNDMPAQGARLEHFFDY